MNNKEIKEGEYVRLKYGYIGYIENINDFREPSRKYAVNIQRKDLVFVGEEYVLKHSNNIIDLIEVGDYVNGYLINYIPTNEKAIYHDAADCEDVRCFTNETIKSIVTKEAFSFIEYKL